MVEYNGFDSKLAAMRTAQQKDVHQLRKQLEAKLNEYGTVELMAFLAIREYFLKTIFYDSTEARSEKPYMKYLFGLFLSNYNLNASRPTMDQIDKIEELVLKYFKSFQMLLILSNPPNNKNWQMNFSSQLQILNEDVDPRAYSHQKNKYLTQVFIPLNYHFVSKHGFTIEQTFDFSRNIAINITSKMKNEMHQLQLANLEKTFVNLSRILIIDVEDYCTKHNIGDKSAFKNYLNTFSCTFGEQINEFSDPLSENILSYKPIIKINENTFVMTQPLLIADTRLDLLLSHLLENEKQNRSPVWNKFNELKSTYLENAAFEIFEKMFPNCVYKNAHYKFQGKEGETDLLVMYGNRVLIVESKSNNIPTYAKQLGNKEMEKRLQDIVGKGCAQATKAKKYIQFNSKATFWEDAKQRKVLVETDTTKNDYKFYYIGVTLEDLGNLGTNPKNLEPLGYFSDNEYPWLVYLYDLDVISDILTEPIYLIHYIEQRVNMHVLNNLESSSELDFLGLYINNGHFSKADTKTYVDGSYIKQFDDYYVRDGKKPKLAIPTNFESLLLDMQGHYKEKFTDAACLLLDFSYSHKVAIMDWIAKKNNKSIQTKKPAMFTIPDYDDKIGISYIAYYSLDPLPQNFKNQTTSGNIPNGIVRFITIGRNVVVQNHQATFFTYFNSGKAYHYALDSN